MKARLGRTSGMLFIMSGLTWFLAAALGKQLVFAGAGVLSLMAGALLIAKAKKSAAF